MFGRFLCIGRSRLQNNSFGLSLSILDRRGAKIKVTICRSNGSWGKVSQLLWSTEGDESSPDGAMTRSPPGGRHETIQRA